MSSGQSARNGSSVEPGLPNTFLMPKARSRPKVASLTLTVPPWVGADFRDDIGRLLARVLGFSVIARKKRRSSPPVDGLVREGKQCGREVRNQDSGSCLVSFSVLLGMTAGKLPREPGRGSNDGYSLRRHSGRRNHLDVKRNLPTFGKAHARRRVSRARTLQHEAVIGIVHYFIAFLHIDWKAADVGHEHAGSSGNVGSDIPGAASRTQRNRRDVVDVGHPGVLVGFQALDVRGADIAHVAEAIG